MNVNVNFSNRTKILAAVAATLAVICAAQLLLGLRSPQKTFKLKSEPDFISIESDGKTTTLNKNDNGEWFCASELLDTAKVELTQKSFNPLKTLGVTSRSSSKAALERYGLDNPVSLRVQSKGKTLLSILIGKDSSSGKQSYIQIEGKKEIYLARGNLRTLWGNFSVDAMKPDPKTEEAPAQEPAQEEKAQEEAPKEI